MFDVIKLITGLPPEVALALGVVLAINIYNAYRAQYREQMIMMLISQKIVNGRTKKPYISIEDWNALGLLGGKFLP